MLARGHKVLALDTALLRETGGTCREEVGTGGPGMGQEQAGEGVVRGRGVGGAVHTSDGVAEHSRGRGVPGDGGPAREGVGGRAQGQGQGLARRE